MKDPEAAFVLDGVALMADQVPDPRAVAGVMAAVALAFALLFGAATWALFEGHLEGSHPWLLRGGRGLTLLFIAVVGTLGPIKRAYGFERSVFLAIFAFPALLTGGYALALAALLSQGTARDAALRDGALLSGLLAALLSLALARLTDPSPEPGFAKLRRSAAAVGASALMLAALALALRDGHLGLPTSPELPASLLALSLAGAAPALAVSALALLGSRRGGSAGGAGAGLAGGALPLLALLSAASLLPSPAAAQAVSGGVSRDLDLDRFAPAPDADGFLTMPGSHAPGEGRWTASLFFSYAREPLSAITSAGERVPLITDRLVADAVIEVGLFDRAALVLDVPLVVTQEGDLTILDAGPRLPGTALRDPRLSARVRLLGEVGESRARREGEGLAVQISATAPLGRRDAYAGEGSPTLEAHLIGDLRIFDFGFGLSLGARHRFSEPVILGSSFRNELLATLALQIPTILVPDLSALLELSAGTDMENPFGDSASTPVILDLALRWRVGGPGGELCLTGGAGAGLSGGVGAPAVRAHLGLAYTPSRGDADGDGISDEQDECPELREDADGFEDEDGCPDPDNDRDGIDDLDDACPDAAADPDEDENEDGCADRR